MGTGERAGGSPLRVVAGKKGSPTVMLVTGETSGDEHGAELVHHLLQLSPDSKVFGMGGSRLRAAGMETIVDSEAAAAVMGFTEVLGSLGKLLAALRTLKREAKRRRPDVVVLIDFPDFNLLLARSLKRLGIKVLYFITPQLWAWRKNRVKTIRKVVRKVAPIFPFEESFFQRHGVDAEYVGHPFLDRPPLTVTTEEFHQQNGLDPRRPILALLPGSRKAEVELLMGPMLSAFERLKVSRPNFQAVVPRASGVSPDLLESFCKTYPDVKVIHGQARELLQFARAGIVASGTATVEAALAGIPFVVVYRLSNLSYRAAKLLVRGVRHFAMPNLIAGKKVVPELLQSEVTGEKLYFELEAILGDPMKEQRMRDDISLVRQRLEAGRKPGETSSQRVAEMVMAIAGEGRRSRMYRPSSESRRQEGGV